MSVFLFANEQNGVLESYDGANYSGLPNVAVSDLLTNVISINSTSINVSSSAANLFINSSSLVFGNASAATLEVNSSVMNVGSNFAISINGSNGTANQVLITNGSAISWGSAFSNGNAYTWSGVQTFNANVVFGNSTVNSAVNSTYVAVQNSTTNTVLTPGSIVIGNTTVNGSTLAVNTITSNTLTINTINIISSINVGSGNTQLYANGLISTNTLIGTCANSAVLTGYLNITSNTTSPIILGCFTNTSFSTFNVKFRNLLPVTNAMDFYMYFYDKNNSALSNSHYYAGGLIQSSYWDAAVTTSFHMTYGARVSNVKANGGYNCQFDVHNPMSNSQGVCYNGSYGYFDTSFGAYASGTIAGVYANTTHLGVGGIVCFFWNGSAAVNAVSGSIEVWGIN